MGGNRKRGTGRVSSLALHRKRSSILRVIAVVIICNFHFIKDRPLYFLVKGGKRLFGVIFSLQEFLFITVRFYQNFVLFGLFVLFFFCLFGFGVTHYAGFFFFSLKNTMAHLLLVMTTVNIHGGHIFMNVYCTRLRYLTPLNPALRNSPVFKPTQL